MKVAEVKSILKRNSGLLTEKEGLFLYDLAKSANYFGDIVEIGSYKGGSTVLLAKGVKDSVNKEAKIYAIDPHGDELERKFYGDKPLIDMHSIFEKNIEKEKVGKFIVPLVKTSLEAANKWSKPIKILWIDGNHDYNSVKLDFLFWEQYIIDGGIIVFHDSQDSGGIIETVKIPAKRFYGPHRVVKKFIFNSKRFTDIKIVDTITVARKVKDAGKIEFLKNKFLIFITKILLKLGFLKNVPWMIDRFMGNMGILINKLSPKSYVFLKSVKLRLKL